MSESECRFRLVYRHVDGKLKIIECVFAIIHFKYNNFSLLFIFLVLLCFKFAEVDCTNVSAFVSVCVSI